VRKVAGDRRKLTAGGDLEAERQGDEKHEEAAREIG